MAEDSSVTKILHNLELVAGQLTSTMSQQGQLLQRQQAQLDGMQEQLGMLTELAMKLAVVEERRAEDKAIVLDLSKRVEVLRDKISERFPLYDRMNDAYVSVNNKLWGAIVVGVVGLLLAAFRVGGS